jgi:hypothetical protein
MSANMFYCCGLVAIGLPFLAIAVVLLHYALRRTVRRRKQRRKEKTVASFPSSASLGAAFLFLQTFIRPSLQNIVEIRQEECGGEDDSGGPESPEKNLHRQLKHIRRGEIVSDLILRM